MRQRNPLHACVLGELYHVFDRAMPPTNLFWIFFCSVLSVVDEKVGALNKLSMLEILAGDLAVADGQHACIWLVIARIHQNCVINLQAVTKCHRGVIKLASRNFDVLDLESTFNKIMITDLGLALIQRNGEIGVLHLAGQSLS